MKRFFFLIFIFRAVPQIENRVFAVFFSRKEVNYYICDFEESQT